MSKHAKLALCMERKTAPKKWYSGLALGHVVSYDEVALVETFLADEYDKHQNIKS